MKDRVIKATTITFLFILFSPILGWLVGLNVHLDERRHLSPRPKVSISELRYGDFFSSFDKFFNDHFAYRVALIKAKNWIDYYVFQTSPSANVHIGTGGWFYLQESANDFFKIYGCKPEEAERMRSIARQIHDLEGLIEGSGRQFVFLVAPNKETIYPEYYGLQSPPPGKCVKSRYDLFLESLEEYPINNFIRLDPVLKDAKRNEEIYYRTDSHWNFAATHIVGEMLLQYLLPTEWSDLFPQVKFTSGFHPGDLSRMMSLDIKEVSLVNKDVLYPVQVQELVTDQSYPGRDQLRYSVISSSGKPLLPRSILYRDSFATAFVPYVKGAFDQLEVVWFQNDKGDLVLRPSHMNILKSSRIVIFEVVERYLPNLSIDLPAWESVLQKEEMSSYASRKQFTR